MEEVCDREKLKQALQRVKSNKGSPGIEGMTVGRVTGLSEATLASDSGTTARRNLQAATGEAGGNPQAGRRSAPIGHSDGAGSVPPTGGDAGLQGRWDPTFSEHSHGFGPRRSAHQAVAKGQQYIAEGNRWVVDLDLEKFFDRVNHDKLMAAMARRVSDKSALRGGLQYLRGERTSGETSHAEHDQFPPAATQAQGKRGEERGGTAAGAKVSGLQLYGRSRSETAHRAERSAPL
jgi:hypothetical protein